MIVGVRRGLGHELAVLASELACLELLLLVLWDATSGAAATPVWLLGLVAPAGLLVGHSQTADRWLRRRGLEPAALSLVGLLAVWLLCYGDRPLFETGWPGSLARSVFGTLRGEAPDLVILLAVGIFWWRGRAVVERDLSLRSVVARFQYGLLLLAPIAMVGDTSRPSETIAAAVAYFAAGLVAVGLARGNADRRHGGAGWGMFGFAIAVATAGLVLALTALLISDLPINVARAIAGAIEAVFRAIASLLNGLFGPAAPRATEPIESLRPGRPGGIDPVSLLPDWLRVILTVLTTFFLLFGFIVALRRMVDRVRFHLRITGQGGEGGEAIAEGFQSDLRLLWRRFLAWLAGLRPGRKRTASELPGREIVRPAPPEVAEIRQIYRQLLGLAARNGAHRWPSETPSEHLPALERALAPADEECRRLTDLYLDVRYGGRLPIEEEREAARRCWERARTSLRGSSASPGAE